jgi:hypothetical protein
MRDHNEPYIFSELMTVGKASALVGVKQSSVDRFVASWECSCGASGRDVVQSVTASDAIQEGKDDFLDHCCTNHV